MLGALGIKSFAWTMKNGHWIYIISYARIVLYSIATVESLTWSITDSKHNDPCVCRCVQEHHVEVWTLVGLMHSTHNIWQALVVRRKNASPPPGMCCELLPAVSSQSPKLRLMSSKDTEPQSQILLQVLTKTIWTAKHNSEQSLRQL